ncbi:MAG: type IV pilus secretin PilQ [Syntrophaceae bacterium]
MADKNCGRRAIWITLVFFLGVFATGCAADKSVKKDPFFEKWETMAEKSTGHSPAPRSREDVKELVKKEETRLKTERERASGRTLPTVPITLKMRQADVKAVLRSLARIVNQNVLIRDDIKGEVSIDFKNTPWNQAFYSILKNQSLAYEWEGNIIRVMTIADKEQDLKRKTQEKEEKLVDPLITVFIPIDYADTKGLRENLQEFLTKDKDGKPRGSIRADDHSNGLIIHAISDDLMRMIPIIEKIDKPTPQILIKANIVETTKDTARNLGIQWGGMYNPRVGNHDLWVTPGGTMGSTTTNPISGGYTPAYGSTGLSGQGFGVNFPATISGTAAGTLGLMFGTLGGNILEMQLSALQTEGKLNILSSPSITTMDNQTAFTENGERVPYVTQEVSSGTVTNVVKFEDVVLRLKIKPHVIDRNNLRMEIEVKKDEVDNTRNVQGNPYIIKKTTSTILIVKDGETIVISGLTKHKIQASDSGIPGFKDIHGLGWLFKTENKSETMQEVLIFITPTILPVQNVAAIPEGSNTKGEKAP